MSLPRLSQIPLIAGLLTTSACAAVYPNIDELKGTYGKRLADTLQADIAKTVNSPNGNGPGWEVFEVVPSEKLLAPGCFYDGAKMEITENLQSSENKPPLEVSLTLHQICPNNGRANLTIHPVFPRFGITKSGVVYLSTAKTDGPYNINTDLYQYDSIFKTEVPESYAFPFSHVIPETAKSSSDHKEFFAANLPEGCAIKSRRTQILYDHTTRLFDASVYLYVNECKGEKGFHMRQSNSCEAPVFSLKGGVPIIIDCKPAHPEEK